MIAYNLRESQNGSLFIVTSKRENLYGLSFENKDIEIMNFDNDFLQERMVEMAIVKLTTNKAKCIKHVTEGCEQIFNEVIQGKFSNKIIFLTVTSKSTKARLIKLLAIKNKTQDLVRLRITNVGGQSFYFFFNEKHTSTVEVLTALAHYFKTEYGIDLNTNFKE